MTSRRELLAGLAATVGVSLLPGCRHVVAPVAAAREAARTVRLGWRWIPGTSFTYDSVVTRQVDRVSFVRGEAWTYTATALDPSGVVTLRGALVGFGATITAKGEELDDPRLRAAREAARDGAPTEVDLRLRLTGRLLACSLEGFAESLPHRMLALALPSDPVRVGASWDDPALALALARLLPVELPVGVTSRTTFSAFEDVERSWQARLTHAATISTTDGGPVLRLTGTTLWDTDPGAIASRRIEVHLDPDEPVGGVPLGVLRVELNRDRKGEAGPPVATQPTLPHAPPV